MSDYLNSNKIRIAAAATAALITVAGGYMYIRSKSSTSSNKTKQETKRDPPKESPVGSSPAATPTNVQSEESPQNGEPAPQKTLSPEDEENSKKGTVVYTVCFHYTVYIIINTKICKRYN